MVRNIDHSVPTLHRPIFLFMRVTFCKGFTFVNPFYFKIFKDKNNCLVVVVIEVVGILLPYFQGCNSAVQISFCLFPFDTKFFFSD